LTALMVAAHRGRVEMVKLLIGSGAEVNEATREGKTALMLAAQNGDLPVVRTLLEAGADRNVMDETGKLAFEYAAAGNHSNLVELLRVKPRQ
jgi:serine/threonine-protein phosphatase 6 regulatory ankyrin repeat subunit B